MADEQNNGVHQNRLSDPEKFRLWSWMQANKAVLEEDKLTAEKIVHRARAATSIPNISEDHIRAAARATGVRLSAQSKGGFTPLWNGIRAVEKKLADHEAKCVTLFQQDFKDLEDLKARLASLESALGITHDKVTTGK